MPVEQKMREVRTQPKYQQLAGVLEKKILQGKYTSGDRFSSAREIGEQFRVSIATASKSLQLLVRDGRLDICRGVGTFVKELSPENKKKSSDVTIKVVTIVMFSEIQDLVGTYTGLITGLRDVLPETIVRMEYIPRGHWRDSVDHLPFDANHAYILISGSVELRRFFAKQVSPTVLIGNPEPELELSSVTNNEDEAMARVVHLLVDKGHKSIMYVAPPEENWVQGDKLRYSAFKKTLIDSGLHDVASEMLSLQCPPMQQKIVKTRVKDFFSGLHRPTAIICWSSVMCCWMIETIKEIGLSIPKDVAIFSLGDAELNDLVTPKISSLGLSYYVMGASAGRIIFDLAKNHEKKSIQNVQPYEIVERETT